MPDKAPSVDQWRWTMIGTLPRSSPGSMRHGSEESGTIEAEGAGEVFDVIVKTGPWDLFDQDESVTITVEPVDAS